VDVGWTKNGQRSANGDKLRNQQCTRNQNLTQPDLSPQTKLGLKESTSFIGGGGQDSQVLPTEGAIKKKKKNFSGIGKMEIRTVNRRGL